MKTEAGMCFAFTRTKPPSLAVPPRHPSPRRAMVRETPRDGDAPSLMPSAPSLPSPSAGDFLIKASEARCAAGKRAFQGGRAGDARPEFDRGVEPPLTARGNPPGRPRLERRLEEMVDAIYR